MQTVAAVARESGQVAATRGREEPSGERALPAEGGPGVRVEGVAALRAGAGSGSRAPECRTGREHGMQARGCVRAGLCVHVCV